VSGSDHDSPASHKPGRGGHEDEHEEHVNHEAWVIPYADMLTLLMALFLMLWATSTTDQAKFAALAESLRDAFTGGGTGELVQTVTIGSPGVLDGQESGVTNGDNDVTVKKPTADELTSAAFTEPTPPRSLGQEALQREKDKTGAKAAEDKTFNDAQKKIAERAAAEGVAGQIKFRREERGLVVTVVTDNVLFQPGSAVLAPTGENIVRIVTEVLRDVPNGVSVEGHTDTTPIATSQYPSNWELSTGRSTSVLRNMVERVGYDANRISSAGYGQTRPIDTNATAAGRSANRRVEVVVLAEVQ